MGKDAEATRECDFWSSQLGDTLLVVCSMEINLPALHSPGNGSEAILSTRGRRQRRACLTQPSRCQPTSRWVRLALTGHAGQSDQQITWGTTGPSGDHGGGHIASIGGSGLGGRCWPWGKGGHEAAVDKVSAQAAPHTVATHTLCSSHHCGSATATATAGDDDRKKKRFVVSVSADEAAPQVSTDVRVR